MRLLHTTYFYLQDFYEVEIPEYAILSHRWGSPEDEVSYLDFIAGRKQFTSGYFKIKAFCKTAAEFELDFCWVDTCCIDKSSSAELSEAINSMFNWYRKAKVCYVYLQDVFDASSIQSSDWFTRGWTLQELIAPKSVIFKDRHWRHLGSKTDFPDVVSRASAVHAKLLMGDSRLVDYSVAQIMSWAAHRKTSRPEDQAYCLLGLFGVNMPLLYGEGSGAFRRLQEEILARGADNSLFVWGFDSDDSGERGHPSILAPSPSAFKGCEIIEKGFASQRILFEKTSRGIMVLIHRSYDRKTLDTLLQWLGDTADKDFNAPLGLTIPLGCAQRWLNTGPPEYETMEALFLKLVLDRGKWHRVGVVCGYNETSMVGYEGNHYFAYTNDYVRIYIHHDRSADELEPAIESAVTSRPIHYLHLRDSYTI